MCVKKKKSFALNDHVFLDENYKGGHVDKNIRQAVSEVVFYDMRNSNRYIQDSGHLNDCVSTGDNLDHDFDLIGFFL